MIHKKPTRFHNNICISLEHQIYAYGILCEVIDDNRWKGLHKKVFFDWTFHKIFLEISKEQWLYTIKLNQTGTTSRQEIVSHFWKTYLNFQRGEYCYISVHSVVGKIGKTWTLRNEWLCHDTPHAILLFKKLLVNFSWVNKHRYYKQVIIWWKRGYSSW